MNAEHPFGLIGGRQIGIIIVFGLVMLGFSSLMYVTLDNVTRDYTKRRVVAHAYDDATQYSRELLIESERLAAVARSVRLENGENISDGQILRAFVRQNRAGQDGIVTGVLDASGEAVIGEERPSSKYPGIIESLRGSGGISFSADSEVVFAQPVENDGNISYVLYELFSKEAFQRIFPVYEYGGRGCARLSTVDNEEVIPFYATDKERSARIVDSDLNEEIKNLVKSLNLSTSVTIVEKTKYGEMYFYAAEVEGTNFVYNGFIDRSIISEGLDRIPRLVFLVLFIIALMMIAMAIFLLISNQKARESTALREAKLAAEDASKAKSDFLANMSHEIRTPINTILGMDEMLLRETTDPALRKYCVNIQRAGNALLSQINDVLDFSKIEAGKMELFPEEYDVAGLAADMQSMIAPRAVSKGLTFNLEVDSQIPGTLYGDEARLKQVILNLLTNAVKYTREGGVTLGISYNRVGSDDIMMHVSVEDTGIGIKSEDVEKLFTAFERIEEERNRTIEGTGLGMNIVCSLLELMDSKPQVSSTYGRGSTFYFDVRQKVVNWEPMGEFNGLADKAETVEEYHVAFEAPEANVLLVDDTEMNLMVVKGLLKDNRIAIDTALDGKQALSLTQQKIYDVLLVDHRMPVMDGKEMIAALRADDNNLNQHKPCIALTANAVAGARDEYLEAGFDDYMVKPVKGILLEDILRKYIPPEKVIILGRDQAGADEEPAAEEPQDDQATVLAQIEEKGYLDVKEGVGYAGTVEMYMKALEFFVASIDAKSEEIRKYYEEEDWELYRTKVHGLKSSAKMIGAMELSGRARSLEMAVGDEDFDYIREHTGDVLTFFGSYKEKLKGIKV